MQKHLLRWGSMLMIALGLWILMGWLSSAEAVIVVRSADIDAFILSPSTRTRPTMV
jgi:hypothetical protein